MDIGPNSGESNGKEHGKLNGKRDYIGVICTWGFPKIRGTFLGAPIIRMIVFGVTLGSPYFGKLAYLKYEAPKSPAVGTRVRCKFFPWRWRCGGEKG